MRILSPHSQIINLHEVYDGENTIYLVMDLCLGNNLQSELKKRSNILDNSEIKIVT
jgi:calcium-dependent protein kinase